MPAATPSGSGSFTRPTALDGMSGRPVSSSGPMSRTTPASVAAPPPTAAQRIWLRTAGVAARNPRTVRTTPTRTVGMITRSWTIGHVPSHAGADAGGHDERGGRRLFGSPPQDVRCHGLEHDREEEHAPVVDQDVGVVVSGEGHRDPQRRSRPSDVVGDGGRAVDVAAIQSRGPDAPPPRTAGGAGPPGGARSAGG